MHSKTMLVAIFFTALVVSGCFGPKKVANVQEMIVEFEFEVAECTDRKTSPEIRVKNVPDGTVFLQAKFRDLDYLSYNHGGGIIEYKGGGIIPTGALEHYTSPCSPSKDNRYEFTVKALNGDKSLVLGEGKAMRRQ